MARALWYRTSHYIDASEYDAAVTLLGMSEDDYAESMVASTAVTRGYDFRLHDVRYQIKANRPSGKPGSIVTLCATAKNYDWDRLIWMLYSRDYEIQEAWQWDVETYKRKLHEVVRISPRHMREGQAMKCGVRLSGRQV
jgi:hypothetical protein